MPHVEFDGWEPPLDKVALNKLLRRHCGFSLSEAKDIVDAVVDGRHTVVSVDDDGQAAQLVRDAAQIGAACHVIADQPADSRSS